MITQEELKKLLHYDPETGIFTHLTRRTNAIKIAQIAGTKHVSKSGKTYVRIKIAGERHLAHVLVWLYIYGCFPKGDIDHINGNGQDNKLINLREVSRRENSKNTRRYSNNTSGVCGVSWFRQSGKWRAVIRSEGILKHLGLFDNLADAKKARKEAEVFYGFHSNHGSDRPL